MKRTVKYSSAVELLTFPHETQDELYLELNRLGWWWNSKKKTWERNDELKANPATELVRIRVWAATEKVESIANIIIEAIEPYGLTHLEKSVPYACRPPQQLESRVYLMFSDSEQTQT